MSEDSYFNGAYDMTCVSSCCMGINPADFQVIRSVEIEPISIDSQTGEEPAAVEDRGYNLSADLTGGKVPKGFGKFKIFGLEL